MSSGCVGPEQGWLPATSCLPAPRLSKPCGVFLSSSQTRRSESERMQQRCWQGGSSCLSSGRDGIASGGVKTQQLRFPHGAAVRSRYLLLLARGVSPLGSFQGILIFALIPRFHPAAVSFGSRWRRVPPVPPSGAGPPLAAGINLSGGRGLVCITLGFGGALSVLAALRTAPRRP